VQRRPPKFYEFLQPAGSIPYSQAGWQTSVIVTLITNGFGQREQCFSITSTVLLLNIESTVESSPKLCTTDPNKTATPLFTAQAICCNCTPCPPHFTYTIVLGIFFRSRRESIRGYKFASEKLNERKYIRACSVRIIFRLVPIDTVAGGRHFCLVSTVHDSRQNQTYARQAPIRAIARCCHGYTGLAAQRISSHQRITSAVSEQQL